MDTADQLDDVTARCLQFRDGLFMALLASCGRRLRAMSSLRLGHELVRGGERYRLEIPPELDKTRRYDAFDVRDRLTPYLDRYLHDIRPTLLDIRPTLLAGNVSDWLWVNRDGGRLSAKTFQHHVHRRTKQRFGHGSGPHKFKHAAATACALHAPEVPGLAGSVLRTSAAVLEMHYIRANQVLAVQAYEDVLKQRQNPGRQSR
jgi:site-specific recombinase XerD